nr:SDR family NAD(P)-dependent oxidoreductase [Paenibacillus apiarius]
MFILSKEELQDVIEKLIQQKQYGRLLDFWAKGLHFDWDALYNDIEIKPCLISLPTYPFAREKYWAPLNIEQLSTQKSQRDFIHPLVHENTSDFIGQRFSSTFTGKEGFLTNEAIEGQKRLPEAAHLEMARAAVARSMDGKGTGILLKDVIWNEPILFDESPKQVHIALNVGNQGEIDWEIYERSEEQEEEFIISTEGKASHQAIVQAPPLDLNDLRSRCSHKIDSIEEVWADGAVLAEGAGQLLVQFKQPVADMKERYKELMLLDPALLESCLHALHIYGGDQLPARRLLSLKALEVTAEAGSGVWALIRITANASGWNLDIDLCDTNGNIVSRIRGLQYGQATRAKAEYRPELESLLAATSHANKPDEPFEMMTFEEVWQEEEVLGTEERQENKTLVLFLSESKYQQEVKQRIEELGAGSTRVVWIAQGAGYQKESNYSYTVSLTEKSGYLASLQSVKDDFGSVDGVLFLWALEDKNCVTDSTGIVYMLQGLAKANLKPERVLLVGGYEDGLERCYVESWIGIERSIGLVMADANVSVVCRKKQAEDSFAEWMNVLWTELHTSKPKSVLYEGEQRKVCQIRPVSVSRGGEQLLKRGGTYFITGGIGGLGLIFAHWLATEYGAQLVLVNRSKLDETKQANLEALKRAGAEVIYLQADVCDASQMKEAVKAGKKHFKRIDGVIHAAGIEGGKRLVDKELEEYQRTLEPKIKGTLVLEEALQGEQLDFICYFSSSSAIIGDFGSCDYAVGNRFQMCYAQYRNSKGGTDGKRIVINWPLWKSGGMGFADEAGSLMYLKSSGQRFLEAAEGTALFEQMLSQERAQHLVLVGQRERVHRFLGLSEAVSSAPPVQKVKAAGKGKRPEMKGWTVEQCVLWELKDTAGHIIKIPREKLDVDENLANFGFDSISLARFADALSNRYELEITPDLFFGYPTLESLSEYLLAQYAIQMKQFYQEEEKHAPVVFKEIAISQEFRERAVKGGGTKARRTRSGRKGWSDNETEPIAIIGMSGRFPDARSVEELWSILWEGRDVVREIPQERAQWWEAYGYPQNEAGNSKRSGFIPGVAEFDPFFFEISPREAESMDPRQRLLLQESWRALEDAGYGAKSLVGEKIGMFVGVEEGDYHFLAGNEGGITANHNAILAARLSYFLNLNGPNMAINTACSSGLVAVHQACLSLRNGECDTAIVAGANLMVTPAGYLGMEQAGMLSADGKCYAFDKRANGMVPAEAVAVVVLKRLSQAEADRNPVYATIVGSGINYDGKTNGITAPSGQSQTKLLKEVYERFHIHPEEISHIVTHGTGTKLGDPVEINALVDAFKDYTTGKGYCALTSTKSNLGHSLAASGIVSLISLALAMRKETIPASINCEQVNDYIRWEDSPFYINRERMEWTDQEGKRRLGGVSAFGMSGTNAHVVLQSHGSESGDKRRGGEQEPMPYYLLAFSAKTPESLQKRIEDLAVMLEAEQDIGAGVLSAISYTLLEGRQHFNHRCAVVIRDREDAIRVLKQAGGMERLPNLFKGLVAKNFTGQTAIQKYAEDLLTQSRTLLSAPDKYQEILYALAELYCQGYEMAWNGFFGDTPPGLISLPTYPFARETYWAPSNMEQPFTQRGQRGVIHPLVHENISGLTGQRFSSTFTGGEGFLTNEAIEGPKRLPEAAHLEMARAAVALSLDGRSTGILLKDVIWNEPVIVSGKGKQVHVALYPGNHDEIDWEIYEGSEDKEGVIVNSEGKAKRQSIVQAGSLDINALRSLCSHKINIHTEEDKENITSPLSGFMEEVWAAEAVPVEGAGQLLIQFKPSVANRAGRYKEAVILDPALLEACLHAVNLYMGNRWPAGRILGMKELEVVVEAGSIVWAFIRIEEESETGAGVWKLNMDLCDTSGDIVSCMRELQYGQANQVQEEHEHRVAMEDLTAAASPAGKGRRLEMKGWTLEQCVLWELKDTINLILKIPQEKLDADENLENFGFDSISLVEFTGVLSERYELEIKPDLFFSYPTLERLSEYLLTQYPEQMKQFYQEEEAHVPAIFKEIAVSQEISDRTVKGRGSKARRPGSGRKGWSDNEAEPIAIIGMSGRFPDAWNVEELWSILLEGREVIRKAPKERAEWWEEHGHAENGAETGKRIGLVPGVAEFDPLFFEISPREAEIMDPRQRLLLQESWKALEDAGYGAKQLAGEKIGMFVGVEEGDYQLLVGNEGGITSNNNAILAARLSYFLNLDGPNMAINTACSSGLVAVHQACLSLRNGECDTAIVAGANLMVTPAGYLGMEQAGMLSADGKCYAFDKRANGMVPAEAVAVVVLKRLSQAEADRNPVYATIVGSGINYDGKTNGITAPSGQSQTKLLKEVYERFHIHPEEISHIVTHGTGTKLGDPVEINALVDAFKDYTTGKGYCALTSTKSNLGHSLAASGIVSLISLALAMRKETIPASINCEQVNDYIRWEDSPFYINRERKEWTDQEGKRRLGGVSAFGISGTNAHAVLQSHVSESSDRRRAGEQEPMPYYLLALSAKTPESLQKRIEDLSVMLEAKQEIGAGELSAISCTLLEGRQHFNHRCAVVIRDREDAIRVLKQAGGKERLPNLFQGLVARNFTGQTAIQKYAEDLLTQSRTLLSAPDKYQEMLYALAELYCQGYVIPWPSLFGNTAPCLVNLPTYPFARDKYWAPEITSTQAASQSKAIIMHPLLHQNTSDLSEQRYSSSFTGEEFFLANHVIKGKRVLPGVAYLEMAREAVQQATGSTTEERAGIRLKNMVWAQPIAVTGQPVKVNIGLYPENNGEIGYEIYTETEVGSNGPIVHSQGSAVLVRRGETPTLDLESIQAQCTETISSAQCYKTFRRMGIDYGPGHQGIEEIRVGQGQILAKLTVPGSIMDTHDQYILHPSIMDGALQASVGFIINTEVSEAGNHLNPSLPFTMEKLEIYDRCVSLMWAVIKKENANKQLIKLDIDICDETGNVCVRIKGYASRVLKGEISSAEEAATGTMRLQMNWEEQQISPETSALEYIQQLVIFCELENVPKELEDQQNGAVTSLRSLNLSNKQKEIGLQFQTYAGQVFEEIQTILMEKPGGTVLIQVVVPCQEGRKLYSGLSGLLKTARLENPKLITQLIEMEPTEDTAGIIAKLNAESNSPADNHIRYQDGKRYIPVWKQAQATGETGLPWKEGGIYLITGGAGGLGRIFAKEIAEKVKEATLILTGRSPLSERLQAQLKAIQALGARIEYRQMNVTDKTAVQGLIRKLLEEFGGLDGIIHSAGIIKDNYIIKKTTNEFMEVLAPKVSGVVNLDEATKDIPLDFFILFSSLSGSLGNAGQADYAAANAFMDVYAGHRNDLVKQGQRWGKTQSINWPLWQEGGMKIDAEAERMMEQSTGLTALPTTSGIQAFYQCWASEQGQIMCMSGDSNKIQALIKKPIPSKNLAKYRSAAKEENRTSLETDQEILRENVANYLRRIVSSTLKLPAHVIEADAPMEEYGIDSILVMQLTNQLEEIFGSLSKTLFFEYQTIWELSGYFLESYREQLKEVLGAEAKAAVTQESSNEAAEAEKVVQPVTRNRRQTRFVKQQAFSEEDKHRGALDIAIIGVSGRYPQARNIQEFWDILRNGTDCITEIPKERWNHSLYYDEDKTKPGKTYCKWGGFLEGVDQFDPLFFNISPREAELMDPQERLFLECVYETLEDAGYTRDELGKYQELGLAGNVGVYVGVLYEEYQLYGAQEQSQGRPIVLAGSPSSIANRVSYYCNFHGPSMAIDTMCSSSLTAIHLACESLKHGGCEVAIAGGVNISVHPNKYLLLAQGKFASSKGRCESFGEGGDGYVPGEGVGAVLLKPLSKAIADGDHIYGIIKGTAVNHGGKTNGYTVPNPNSQSGVIGQALKGAGIDPRSISYIEAHGTGTPLGDPIEITGLTKVFHDYTQDKQFCAIGSVKSNIGHCESAAGIAGVTKVLLQLKHGKIAPSLHSKVLNPFIDFEQTPFVVQQELGEWVRPVSEENGVTIEYPRRAGISSFGAGGSNAHVVIEEYVPPENKQPTIQLKNEQNPAIIVLSAKSKEQLKEQARRLKEAIRVNQYSDTDLPAIAYTLQLGREAMEHRFGLIVATVKELGERLTDFTEGREDIENSYQGQMNRNNESLAVLANDEDMVRTVDAWATKGKYGKLLGLWVKGLSFNWNELYSNTKPGRISLPTYPFAREKYWAPTEQTFAPREQRGVIHPLVHENTSGLTGQRFSSTFAGGEGFLTNEAIEGPKRLPEAAHLEMARAAVALSLDGRGTGILLKNVIWNEPVIVSGKGKQVHVALYPGNHDEIDWEIYEGSEDKEGVIVNSEGKAKRQSIVQAGSLDINALRSLCSHKINIHTEEDKENITSPLSGFMEEVWAAEAVPVEGAGQLLIQFKPSVANRAERYKEAVILDPALLEACLHAVNLYMGNRWPAGRILGMKELEVVVEAGSIVWAFIRIEEESETGAGVWKLNMDLCDTSGDIVSCMRELQYGQANQVQEEHEHRVAMEDLTAAASPAGKGRRLEMKGWTLEQCVLWELKDTINLILKIPQEKLDADENLENFGFDSISLVEFAGVLSERYDLEITPDLFFGYPTLERLSEYLLTQYPEQMTQFYQEEEKLVPAAGKKQVVSKTMSKTTIRKGRKPHSGRKGMSESEAEPIAIIGMSGRFPDAWNVEELWSILLEGREVIHKAPKERAEWWLEHGHSENGTDTGKRIGLVPGVAEFDPLFFEISPREAEMMDPRQRLLLQESWKALEDAGYGAKQLAGEKIGMFVGVEEGDYQLLVGDEGGVTSNHNAILAARLSYFLNLDGPNMAINTACSSGLVAVHQACLSLRNGECDTAIVAGANLLLTPGGYLAMEKAGMLSPDGKCHAFDKRANGMVPAEAVAVVVLKRLSQAEADRNQVYATIVGSGINYDGKTNGITAPSGRSQTKLLKEVYERFHIRPEEISHIVTHGTGTKLGDPVEINALVDAFKNEISGKGYCALTSTKSNLGHSLAASGIVSLISLALAMRKETIPASINCEQVNDYIRWEDSPFYINRERKEWTDQEGKRRLGGVSAFGISGTNAHVVLQSHGSESSDRRRVGEQEAMSYYLLAFSAKTPESLQKRIEDLAVMLEAKQEIGAGELSAISCTLLEGRQHFNHRCAVVIQDREDAIRVLKQSGGKERLPNLFRGRVTRDFTTQAAIRKSMEDLLKQSRAALNDPNHYQEILYALAEFYCQGYEMDWNGLFGDTPPCPVSLPTYPFAREKYWVPTEQTFAQRDQRGVIHLLVHENTSGLTGQRFSSTFTGGEVFLTNEAIEGQKRLPEAAHLEMARAAVALSLDGEGTGIMLKDVIWNEPVITSENGNHVHIALYPGNHDEIDWEIYEGSEDKEGVVVNSEGKAKRLSIVQARPLDIHTLRARCSHQINIHMEEDKDNYPLTAFIEESWAAEAAPVEGAGQLLIQFKPSVAARAERYKEAVILDPALLEACLHAVNLYMGNRWPAGRIVGMKELEVVVESGSIVWAFIRIEEEGETGAGVWKLNMDLCDTSGDIVGCIRELQYGQANQVEEEHEHRVAMEDLTAAASPAGKGRRLEMIGWTIEQCVLWELKDMINQILKVPQEKLDADENLENFGFDSISLVEFAGVLSERYELEIKPDLFFSYSTLERLSEYLLTQYPEQMTQFYQEEEKLVHAVAKELVVSKTMSNSTVRKGRKPNFGRKGRSESEAEPIAIIGMSGRFPDAWNVEELWSILLEGRDVVREISQERAQWWEACGYPRDGAGNSKRSGFISGVDEFDPLFFEISPREAEMMDPRQRLLLQESWKALEDAGYGAKQLAGEKIGMFVGVEEGDYQLLVGDEGGVTSNHNAILAARLSYFLNLDGPNMAINTSCSSGLVAVHQACLSLRNGECDTAIVAGANLLLTPGGYLAMEKAGMLSPDGKCHAFGKHANGMVPAEAVAVVVLKRLSQAEADRNPVYATIVGSGINYDGKTNGITAPSGRSQTKLLKEVYERFHIRPEEISHIVTHGTGTKLGDPVEINALADAFKDYTTDKGYCALTSTKSNLGHSLAASGVVSLISLALAMRKETIPASLNCEEVNDYIRWEDSPFYINRERKEWTDQEGKRRLGGVSAFGISGTNAHVVLQSHGSESSDRRRVGEQEAMPYYLLAFSAKTPESLQKRIEDLAVMLEVKQDIGAGVLSAISYTLLEGRQHFNHRCAVVIRDREDAIRVLKQAGGKERLPNLFQGLVVKNFTGQTAIQKYAEDLLTQSRTLLSAPDKYQEILYALAELYCQGYEMAWNGFFGDTAPGLISLPTYPFARETYWAPSNMEQRFTQRGQRGVIHPLVHENISGLTGQRFSSTFTGGEGFLTNEAIEGPKRLPEAAHLEMARAAVALSLDGEGTGIMLKDVIWNEPVITSENGNHVHIALYPGNHDEIDWEIYEGSEDKEGVVVNSEGKAKRLSIVQARPLDIHTLRARCSHQINIHMEEDKDNYPLTAFIEESWAAEAAPVEGAGQLLIQFKPSVAARAERYKEAVILDPALLEACLHAVNLYMGNRWPAGRIVGMKELEVVVESGSIVWAFIRIEEEGETGAGVWKLNMDLCDTSGEIVGCMRELQYGQANQVQEEHEHRSVMKQLMSAASPAGKGRRSEMKGWTLEQCVLWELKDTINLILKIPQEKLDADENLENFGFDSISLVELAGVLSERYELEIKPDLFFSYPTLERLSEYLLTIYPEQMKQFYQEEEEHVPAVFKEIAVSQEISDRTVKGRGTKAREARRPRSGRKGWSDNEAEPIAIIGMSGRFPDAWNVEELWSILLEGREVIRKAPKERAEWWEEHGHAENGAETGKRIGLVPGVAEFDPLFFEISPREAEMMDPRQRLLLQESWKALEDAGYGAKQLAGEKIGMFVGVEEGDYQLLVGDEGGVTSNHNAILAARLSYFLNLDGPNMAINTSCSSGLVAVHQACLSLRNGECDTAIVAGANLLHTPSGYLAMEKAGMLSPDGKCHAFGKHANGMVPAEAVAVVVLKRLSQAEADRNPVYATIVGSGINYDGKTNGITAPSGRSQTKLLKEIYERFHIRPEEISHIVTHGTGTKLGDPVEINALVDAFKDYTGKGYCALTSTKSNLGHSLAASGVVSLISLALAMRKETIPASLNCEEVNDYICWEDSPFYINRERKEWTDQEGKRRLGGVSAFGMSGTNAHVVLQSYGSESSDRRRADGQKPMPYYLLAFSAKTPESLQKRIQEIAEMLEAKLEIGAGELSAISYTLLEGRQHFNHRCAVVIRDREDAVRVLKQAGDKERLPNLFKGLVARDFTIQAAIRKSAEDLLKQSRTAIADANHYQEILYALAEFYCQGYEMAWDGLFGDMAPCLVSLPTYPFAKKEYWARNRRNHHLIRNDSQKQQYQKDSADSTAQQSASVFSTNLESITQSFEKDGAKAKPKVSLMDLKTEMEFLPESDSDADYSTDALLNELIGSLAQELYIDPSEIDVHKPFTELGLDSIIGVEWIRTLNKRYKTAVSTTKIYQYTNLLEFTDYISRELGKGKEGKWKEPKHTKPVTSKPENISLMPLSEGQPYPMIQEKRDVRAILHEASTRSGNGGNPEQNLKLKAEFSIETLLKDLSGSLAKELFIDLEDIDLEKSFTEIGLDSIIGVEWIRAVKKRFKTSIGTTKIYQYPTLPEFAEYLLGLLEQMGVRPEDIDLKLEERIAFNQLLLQVYQGKVDIEHAEKLIFDIQKEK